MQKPPGFILKVEKITTNESEKQLKKAGIKVEMNILVADFRVFSKLIPYKFSFVILIM